MYLYKRHEAILDIKRDEYIVEFRNKEPAVMTKPVTVAFCENGRGFGGAAISLQTYLQAHSDWVKPVIITGRSDSDYANFSKYGEWRVVEMPHLDKVAKHYLGVKLGSAVDYVGSQIPAALRIAYWLRYYKVDLVYLNNDFYCNFAAALGAYLAAKPMLLHLRGFTQTSASSQWVARHLQHFIYISEAIHENGLQFDLPEKKMSYVPEGIDIEGLAHGDGKCFRHEFGLAYDIPVVTLVGGLVGWKGQDILINAAPEILKNHPQARFLLVGSAYGYFSTVERDLCAQIEALGLQQSVLMLGERKDIADILAASDVVVHASTLSEPFGRTVIEGMAAGRAVIAADEGGPRDVIENNVNGLLIKPGDSTILADTIGYLLTHPAIKQQLGQAAAMSVKKFSVQCHVESVEMAIKNALNI